MYCILNKVLLILKIMIIKLTKKDYYPLWMDDDWNIICQYYNYVENSVDYEKDYKSYQYYIVENMKEIRKMRLNYIK